MPVESVVEYERVWVDGLNRGDVSAADVAFAPDCIVHITGIAEPVHGVGPWKEVVAGLLRAFPDVHFTIEDQLMAEPFRSGFGPRVIHPDNKVI